MTPPDRFGRYEILGRIGRGAFAEVYRAWDEELASHVAIKVLNAAASEDEDLRQRFVEEGQLLRRVRSGHVVAVHDAGLLDDDRPYLVVELAHGGTLADRIEQQGAQPCDAASLERIIVSIAEGLEALHGAGVVHRDLKPENLLIGAERSDVEVGDPNLTMIRHGMLASGERLMIGDLGLAKDLEHRGSAPSVIGGSAGFQAPEQLRSDGIIGPPADLYAAAAVLWRLVSGTDCPVAEAVPDAVGAFPASWQTFFLRALHLEAGHRFDSALAWRSAALDHLDVETAAPTIDKNTGVGRHNGSGRSAPCPFKGLAAFQRDDADRFFGREDLIDDLVRRLQSHRVLVVGGASGSGKSSVMRAGLVPALQRGALANSETWKLEVMTPGQRPFDELHYRLERWTGRPLAVSSGDLSQTPQLARRLFDEALDEQEQDGRSRAPTHVLCIDQFEEVFTQMPDPESSARFVDALAAMVDPVDSRLRLLLGVRADFYGRCSQLGWLAQRITDNQVLVGPMSRDGMRRAIEEPARMAGLRIESGLIDAVLDDAGDGAGTLPLISHALVETWTRRDGNALTLDAFRTAGGVAGAIAQSADALFEESLDVEQQTLARRLFLRLVTPGEGTTDTRRPMPLVELDRSPSPRALRDVVDLFVEARLLSVSDTTVEIAHEALISGWPRLSEWIETERDNLKIQQRIGQAARDWDEGDRDGDLLWRGAPLASTEAWATEHSGSLDQLEQEFVEASVQSRIAQEATASQIAVRAQRNRRRVVAGLATLALASIVASVVAFSAFRRASQNAEVAEEQLAVAFGTSALGQADSNPFRALLLSVESIERSTERTVDARSALVQARLTLASDTVVPLGPSVSTPGSFRTALRGDGRLAAVAAQTGPIRLYDTRTGDQVGPTLVRHTRGPRALDFVDDGSALISSGSDGLVVRWELDADGVVGESTLLTESDDIVWALDVHPNGELLALASDDGRLLLVDARTGAERRVIEWSGGEGIVAVRFSPDGERIVASNRDGRLQSWLTLNGTPLWDDDASPSGPNLWDIAFSPDGTRFATAGDRDAAFVHDTETGRAVPGAVFGEPAGRPGAITQVHGVAFSADGSRLIGGSATGSLHSWNIDDPTDVVTTRARHADAVEHGAIDVAHSVYVSVGDDKRLRVWQIPDVAVSTDAGGWPSGAWGAAFDPAGGQIAVGDGNGGVRVFAVDDDGVLGDVSEPVTGHDGRVFDIDWSPDGSLLASVGDDGGVVLWDGKTAEPIGLLGVHGGPTRDVEFSPDGRLLVSSDEQPDDEGRNVIVWDVEERRQIAMLAGHRQGVRAVGFAPDGQTIATADGRGEIRIWSTDDLKLVRQWTAVEQIDTIFAIDFNQDGLLAAADSSEDLRVWDPNSGTQVGRTVSGLDTNGATGVGFDDEGDTIAVMSRSGELRIVDWMTGANLTAEAIRAHPGAESFALTFAPDGSGFVTTGTDGVVRMWNVLSTDVACDVAGRRLDVALDGDIIGDVEPIGCPV